MTATWRPVAWSACSAITVAIDNSVAAVIDTRCSAHNWPRAGDCAHRRSPSSQLLRLDHIGARGTHAPARSTQPRRRSFASARATCGVGAVAAPSGVGHPLLTRGDRAVKKSRFAH
ncbi:hypothetical protein [Mycobacterium avium]|uniref:hypothetical protein n=1 Tax=Mycobacterium avium TaxID=1764 RepID=UPI0020C7FB0D|nr:hypothetical protein [Mycobacterium avium]